MFFVRSYAAEIYIHHAVTQTLLAILSPAEVGDYADHGMCTLSRRTAIAVRYRPQPSSLMGLAAHGSHFAKSQAFFKGRRRFSLPIWTDSSLRIRIRNILGTGSGGGAALTNRLFSDTPDSGCVRHGSGSKVPIEGACRSKVPATFTSLFPLPHGRDSWVVEGAWGARSAWHRVLPTIQDSNILIPHSAG